MKIATAPFNTYFVLALIALFAGCKSGADGKGRQRKEASTLRFHLEVNRDGTDKNGPVQINRARPFMVNIEKAPFLTEHNVVKAAVMDDGLGGFQMFIQFDRQGTWLLEQFTTAHKGKRLAIFSYFGHPREKKKGEIRWLAAPVIVNRIVDGAYAFTPDASREEAERIARGLNNVSKAKQKFNP